jgi:hypothetical protein
LYLGLKETGYVEGDNVTILQRLAFKDITTIPVVGAMADPIDEAITTSGLVRMTSRAMLAKLSCRPSPL